MFIFVSSPYKAVLDMVEDKNKAEEIVINLALEGCKVVRDMGYIPLSPVLAFSGVYDETKERNEALKASLSLLRLCDGILLVESEYSKHSNGMVLEKHLAKELGLSFYTNYTKEKQ